MCIREARQSGRPGDKYTLRYMEAGPCRRPCCIQPGSPTMREAHSNNLHRHGERSSPQAFCVCIREARQSGSPGDKYTLRYMEAGLCRRPNFTQLGSPTRREAHYKDLHRHGNRSGPEA